MPASDPVDLLASDDPVGAFAQAHEQDRLVAVRTSGTSGTPRRIVRTTDSWVDSFPTVTERLGVDSQSRVWLPGPYSSTLYLFAAVHAWWAGARLSDSLAAATHAHFTPSVLRDLLHRDPDSLRDRHLVIAGDRLDQDTRDEAQRVGATVAHYYGAAELSFVAWASPGSTLTIFPGVEIESREGQLWVRSPYVCEGLATDPQGWVTVGDRGEVSGDTVVVKGRRGGVTTSGATVMTADIEHALRPYCVGEVFVTGVPHPDLGAVVAAVLTRAEDLPTLKAVARACLGVAERPRRWLVVPSLPLTGAGKTDRKALPDLFGASAQDHS